MNKERDFSREFLSFLQEKTQNNPDFNSVENCPEAYAAFVPLVNRLRLINKDNLKPRTYKEAKEIMPKLKQITNIYENSFNQFMGMAEKDREEKGKGRKILTNYDLQEFIITKLNVFFFNVLGEEKRKICNEGKHLIANLYDDFYENHYASWTAIQSFRFDFFHNLEPERELFRIKPNPFITYLNFYELGVMPQCFKNGESRIDIPLYNANKNDYFFGCCSAKDNFLITEGHFKEQDCLQKKPLENRQLIVDNRDNAQEQFNFYRPGR